MCLIEEIKLKINEFIIKDRVIYLTPQQSLILGGLILYYPNAAPKTYLHRLLLGNPEEQQVNAAIIELRKKGFEIFNVHSFGFKIGNYFNDKNYGKERC